MLHSGIKNGMERKIVNKIKRKKNSDYKISMMSFHEETEEREGNIHSQIDGIGIYFKPLVIQGRQ